MMRQIILDTETTGLRVEDGHRVIEIACVEMIDRKLTGRHFHYYVNPEREVDAGALEIHGITNEFLKDKPAFGDIATQFIDFITDGELIIHNAPFDVSFLNNELKLCGQAWKGITDYCRLIDTLQMARQLHTGQRNNLDALCKRYGVDHSKRDFHGALLDAHLLAQVYLGMTSGQGSFFDIPHEKQATTRKNGGLAASALSKTYPLTIVKATDAELVEHDKYLQLLQKSGKCLYRDIDVPEESR